MGQRFLPESPIQEITTEVVGAGGGGWRMPKMSRMAFSPEFLAGAEKAARIGRNAAYPLMGVLALADAAGELSDPNDPASRNLSEAGGQLSGNLFGGLGGGALALALGAGTLSGPLAPLVVPAAVAAGSWLGGDPGKQMAAGVYDLITGYKPKTEDEKRREQEWLDAQNLQKIELARYKQMLPIKGDLLDQRYLDDQRRAQLDLQLKNDYNYQNAINQGLLSAQQNAAILNAGLANI